MSSQVGVGVVLSSQLEVQQVISSSAPPLPGLGPQPSSSPSNPTKCNTELESQRWAA